MKLAEALILRADHQKKLEQLKQRLIRNAKVQEGDVPSEEPKVLLEEMERVTSDLANLIKKINRTNSMTEFDTGKSLSDALAEREVMLKRRAMFGDLAQAASVTLNVYSKSEVRFKSTVNISEIQKAADDLSRTYRELDSRIQEMNWKTDLTE